MEWLAGTSADVLCLQEVRAEPQQLPEHVRTPEGWHVVHAPAAAKGRAGGSLYTRREPDRVQVGFGSAEFDGSGRYVEADLPGVTVASLYLPSGEVGTERQDEKIRFMDEFLAYLKDLRERAAADGREVVVCGDWNIAPPAGRPQELARQPEEFRLPAGGTGVAEPGLRTRRTGRTSMSYGRCIRTWRGRTRGGRTGGGPSTTTADGASTTT
ncbi:exodeoxyribonuclease III [Streptomyces sp. L7]